MGFWPTGPITIFSAVVVLFIAAGFLISGDRSQRMIGLAFVVSWVGARLSTATEIPIFTAFGATIAAVICLFGFTVASRAIATIYGLRLVLLSGLGFGFWDWFLLWELNLVLFYLQILIAVGTIGGYSRMARRLLAHSGIAGWAYRALGLPPARPDSDVHH